MTKLNVRLFADQPILDIASFARRGPGRRDWLSPMDVAHIARTVRRVPEVVVKVLPRDSSKLAPVSRHIDYIGRGGDLPLETDEGERLSGRRIGREVLQDWDLDLDEHRRQADLAAALGRKPAKLVHKLMFSMPPGTPPDKVLAAVRNFAREQFALQHRYVFVLHTDEAHPHVHLVVKAMSEHGVRLNIRKATLRQWRSEFARHLRLLGVSANATERAVRGESRKAKHDGVYRAHLRGCSSWLRAQVEHLAVEIGRSNTYSDPGKSTLMDTRRAIVAGWQAAAKKLADSGHEDLSSDIQHFLTRMPPVRTEKEILVHDLLRRTQRVRNDPVR